MDALRESYEILIFVLGSLRKILDLRNILKYEVDKLHTYSLHVPVLVGTSALGQSKNCNFSTINNEYKLYMFRQKIMNINLI